MKKKITIVKFISFALVDVQEVSFEKDDKILWFNSSDTTPKEITVKKTTITIFETFFNRMRIQLKKPNR